MLRKRKEYVTLSGQPMLGLPIGKKESINAKRRQVRQMSTMSACELLNKTRFERKNKILLLGDFSQALMFARAYGNNNVTLIATDTILKKYNLKKVFSDYEVNISSEALSIPRGRGILSLEPDHIIHLRKFLYNLSETHKFVIFTGGGLVIKEELLSAILNHNVLFIAQSIYNAVPFGIQPIEILCRMDGIIVGAAASSLPRVKELLPNYNAAVVDTTMGIGFHREPVYETEMRKKRKKIRGGIDWQQSRHTEERSVLSEEDLALISKRRQLLILDSEDREVIVAGPVIG